MDYVDIPGYVGIYAASADGRIWSLPYIEKVSGQMGQRKRRFREKKTRPDSMGKYRIVDLVKKDSTGPLRKKTSLVHRVIALTFLGPSPQGRDYVNHKDGDTQNNAVDNLEWCSRSENMRHAFRVLKRVPGGLGRFGKKSARSRPVVGVLPNGLRLYFDNPLMAARSLGIDQSSIHRVCKGSMKTCGKIRWHYVNDECSRALPASA